VLTDYGESRAYGLDSPVFAVDSTRLDVVTRSHDHPDHAGGELPQGIGHLVANRQAFQDRGLTITRIATFEQTQEAPDNTSYLFERETADWESVEVIGLTAGPLLH
jgi:metal-dependent hydrolase (beta-lactamase superfamily II)